MKLSVVVCTKDRADSLDRCIASIDASLKNAAPLDAEIVIINNASTDNTEEVVKAWNEKSDFEVRHVYEAKKGIGPARNCGMRSATGDVIIWTDDDCVLDIDHISQAVAYYKNDKEPTLRYGSVYLGDEKDWPMTVHTCPYIRQWKKDRSDLPFPNMGSMIGCNMMIPREIIEAVGPYDERFGTKIIPGGEDADLGFRIYDLGYLIEYVPDMRVKHFHGRDTAEAVRKLVQNYAIGAGGLYAKYLWRHPHIRRIIAGRSRAHPTEGDNKVPVVPTDPRSKDVRLFHEEAKKFYFIGFVRFFKVSFARNFES